jgi:hypothetical protein
MSELNRSDLTAWYNAKILEGQSDEEITPDLHNDVNDAFRDSNLNKIDDLAGDDDFITLVAAKKIYVNPFFVMKYALAKSSKATALEVAAGTNNTKYITPAGLAGAGLSGGAEMTGAAASALSFTGNWLDPADSGNVNYPFYTNPDMTPFAAYGEHAYCIVEDSYSGSTWLVQYKKMATVLTLFRIAILIKNL